MIISQELRNNALMNSDFKNYASVNLTTEEIMRRHKVIESQFKRKEYHSLAQDLYNNKVGYDAGDMVRKLDKHLNQSSMDKENQKPNSANGKRVDQLLAKNPNWLLKSRIDHAVFTRNQLDKENQAEPIMRRQPQQRNHSGSETGLLPLAESKSFAQ